MKFWFFGILKSFFKENQGTCDKMFVLQNGEKFTPNKRLFAQYPLIGASKKLVFIGGDVGSF
jgi:hypothetical protein